MTRFRQALLDELRSRVTDPPAAIPHSRRLARPSRLQLAFGGAALAVTAAAGLAVVLKPTATPTATSAQPDYTVTTEANGIVLVSTNRGGDPTAANQALGSATSNRVVIIPVSDPADCPVANRGTRVPGGRENLQIAREVLREQRDNTVRIQPGSIPHDWILVLSPGIKLPNSSPTITGVGWYLTPGPKCVINNLNDRFPGSAPDGNLPSSAN